MIKKPPRPPRFYTPEQRKEFIDKWENSDLSQRDFCRKYELTYSVFGRWRNKITRLESGLSLSKASPTASFHSPFPSLTSEKPGLVHKKKYRKPRYHTVTQWKEFIDDWKQSGLSQGNYCRQKNLTDSSFIEWRKKFENPELAKLASLQERTRYTFEQWKEFIDDWKQSGLSKDAYCLQKNLAPTTFFNWSKKLEDPELAKIAGLQERPHYDPNQWKEFIEEWEQSGLSIASYCAKNGLNLASFYKWRQKFKFTKRPLQVKELPQKQKPSPSFSFEENFIPVMLKPPSLTNASNVNPRIEVTLSQGHHLSIQGPFDWGNLIALLTSI